MSGLSLIARPLAALFLMTASAALAVDQNDPAATGTATAGHGLQEHIDGAVFDPARNAVADVDAALAAARISGRAVLIVFGGNWCHDSRALATLFASDRFRPMLAARYELVFVDVGMRDRNLDLARRFGLDGIAGTPTVLILAPDGRAQNLRDAPRWRNAASRKPAAVFRHFERAAPARD